MNRIDFERGQYLLLPLTSLVAMAAFFQTSANGSDMTRFLIPWMDAVRAGGLSSLSGEFSNYTPPYVYLMYLASWLVPLVGTVAVIKLICLPFVLIMSVGIHGIVLAASGSRTRALAAACAVWVLPTLFVNAFYWGQADVIYGSALIWFVLLAMKEKPAWAAAAFGIALALKFQAMFLSPVLLYLLLAGRMRPWHLLLIPAAYAAMMIPAVLAGRPWSECLTVYFNQYQSVSTLSANAPNPWRVAKKFIGMEAGVVLGLAAGLAAGLAVALTSLRLKAGPVTLLLVAAVSAAVLPYVLPKMHVRFFFAADVLSFALAFVLTRYWLAGALIQLGSLLAYMTYLGVTVRGSLAAVVPMSLGLGVLMLALWEAHRRSDGSWREGPRGLSVRRAASAEPRSAS
jgi:Gpi18-like mannosyltransferase